MKIKLTEPYEFEGKKYEELDVDLKKIDGSVLFAAEQELRLEGVVTPLLTYNLRFHAAILGQLCGQPEEFFMKMPGPMIVELSSQVQSFLNNSGLTKILRA